MFIRRTRTRHTAAGESYFSHRLVRSVRLGKQVRQRTLLNLGRHLGNPDQADHRIRCKPITQSSPSRSPVPVEADQ